MMGLSDGERISMMRSAVSVQITRVTDGQTDGIGVAYTRYSIYAVACKKWQIDNLQSKFTAYISTIMLSIASCTGTRLEAVQGASIINFSQHHVTGYASVREPQRKLKG